VRAGSNQFLLAAFLLCLLLAWGYLRISRTIKVLSSRVSSIVGPDYEVDLEIRSDQEGWVTGSIVVMAVKTASIFLGGRLQLLDHKNRKIFDRNLESFGERALGVGQGFRIPIRARLPAEDAARAATLRYSGYIFASDACGIGQFKVPFGVPTGLRGRALLERVGRILVYDEFLAPADAAVVLDGRDFARRLASGLELLRRQHVPRLFVCLSQLHSAQHRAAEEAARQRPDTVTLVRSSALSTLQEAAALRPHLRHDCRSLVVVTSWYHTRRAQLLFERQLKNDGIQVGAYPVEIPALDSAAWWSTSEGRLLIPLELVNLVWTRARVALLGSPDLHFRLKEWMYPKPLRSRSGLPGVTRHFPEQFPLSYVSSRDERDSPLQSRTGSQQPSRRILIIEEQSAIQTLVRDLLGPLGYQADSVHDGREALARISREGYDSVLLDLRHSGEGAEELIPAIRKICPSLVGRVLVITGEVTNQRTLQLIDEHFMLRIPDDRVSRAVPDFLRDISGLPAKI
jgi:CheY-like chemotaxis protein/uncharacterized SAM-binding protein YcdF (DUF218 family)